MKSIQRTLTLLLLTVSLFTGAARAQASIPLVRVNVPFEFLVGNRVLPAGDYSIFRADPSALVVRNSAGRVVATAMTTSTQALTAPVAPKLVFRFTGERNVLTQVWTSNSRYGYEFPAPRPSPAFAASPQMQAAGGR
jgi:hypothetical protein